MKFNLNLIMNLLLALTLLSVSCGGGAQPQAGNGGVTGAPSLSWPPPDSDRLPSDFTALKDGIDYIAAGGNVADLGTDLVLTGEGVLPWAVYGIGDLSADNELISIACVFTETPDAVDDGTELFFAVANYQDGTWMWIDAPTAEAPWICPPANASHYRSPTGEAHIAAVLGGPGMARIESVSFIHETTLIIVDTPENLTAETPAPQAVDLDWDDVTGADGYNVYRSVEAGFTSQSQVNSELVTESTYTDALSTDGRYYFYRVTAVASNESDPSNIARVWVFGDDLPAPFDLALTARGNDSFSVSWDWDDPVGGNPYGFELFIDTIPFFTLQSETMQSSTTFGASRSNTFHDLTPGIAYYWKLCAYDGMGQPLGRMSVELTGTCTGAWTWGEFETIATGQPPVRAVVGDGVIATSYFNGFEIDFAIQDGETWRVETPLPDSPWFFTDYQDLCYGGETFLVTSFAHDPGDCWAAEWDTNDPPGTWNPYMAQGEGTTGLGVPVSGLSVACTASETEFAILLYHLTNTDLILLSKDIGSGLGEDSWTETTIRSNYLAGCTPAHSALYREGNLYVLSTDNLIDELYFGERTGGFAWGDIRDVTAPKLSKYHDLNWFNDAWWSTAYQTADKDLYLIHGTTTPWTADREDGVGGDIAGYYARMAVEGEEAVVIQYKNNKYYFGLYSNNWAWEPINVPGVTEYGNDADVVLFNGAPYIVFQDEDTGEIKIAMGTPPE